MAGQREAAEAERAREREEEERRQREAAEKARWVRQACVFGMDG